MNWALFIGLIVVTVNNYYWKKVITSRLKALEDSNYQAIENQKKILEATTGNPYRKDVDD